jgi:hypothetical protein
MDIRQTFGVAVLVAAIGFIVPAFGQDRSGAASPPDRGMTMGQGHTGHRTTGRDMMRGGMMAGGCGGVMQSMNGGGGRPNSQWQRHPPGNAAPD